MKMLVFILKSDPNILVRTSKAEGPSPISFMLRPTIIFYILQMNGVLAIVIQTTLQALSHRPVKS